MLGDLVPFTPPLLNDVIEEGHDRSTRHRSAFDQAFSKQATTADSVLYFFLGAPSAERAQVRPRSDSTQSTRWACSTDHINTSRLEGRFVPSQASLHLLLESWVGRPEPHSTVSWVEIRVIR